MQSIVRLHLHNYHFMKNLSYLLLITVAVGTVLSCKKKSDLIPDNTPPYSAEVPTVKVQNYVNRLFIDLIGREPLDSEMDAEVATLKAADLSFAAREALIDKLMFDETWRAGDSSYHYAYFLRFYELTKIRALGANSADGTIKQERGLIANAARNDSATGDWIGWAYNRAKIDKCNKLLAANEEYREDIIDIHELYKRCIDNVVFEKEEMYNPNNYARTGFDHYLFRLPTDLERQQVYDMVQDGVAVTHLLGMDGQNKDDYYRIISSCKEWHEGVIRWMYITFLGREATAEEVFNFMLTYGNTMNAQALQKEILKGNDYANF